MFLFPDVLANFDPIPRSWDLDLLNETGVRDHSPYDSGKCPKHLISDGLHSFRGIQGVRSIQHFLKFSTKFSTGCLNLLQNIYVIKKK